MTNIVLDCMGGETYAESLVNGAMSALDKNEDLNLIIVGKYEKFKFEIKRWDKFKNRIEVIDVPNIIEGNDDPVKSIKTKKDSSLVISLETVIKKNYDAVVSTGNTGAFLAGCIFLIGRIGKIKRPALAPVINGKNKFVLLDSGANVDCDVEEFFEFSKMGSIYSKILFKKCDPIVKLLNIGEESGKGNRIIKSVYEELLNSDEINFKGNIEARYLLSDDVDVVVCDGFVGNIVLKTMEGTSKYLVSKIGDEINKSFLYRLGSKLFLNNFNGIRRRYDYQRQGGAVFLGVKKICIKAHGNSNSFSIKNSIELAHKLSSLDFVEEFEKKLL